MPERAAGGNWRGGLGGEEGAAKPMVILFNGRRCLWVGNGRPTHGRCSREGGCTASRVGPGRDLSSGVAGVAIQLPSISYRYLVGVQGYARQLGHRVFLGLHVYPDGPDWNAIQHGAG